MNTTYLGLMKINYNTSGTDSVDVEVYDSSPALVASQTFSSLNLNIPWLSVATDQRNATTVSVDEFRFGTTRGDVFFTIAVPEPGVAALLAHAMLGLSAYASRRRRRGRAASA